MQSLESSSLPVPLPFPTKPALFMVWRTQGRCSASLWAPRFLLRMTLLFFAISLKRVRVSPLWTLVLKDQSGRQHKCSHLLNAFLLCQLCKKQTNNTGVVESNINTHFRVHTLRQRKRHRHSAGRKKDSHRTRSFLEYAYIKL